MTTSQSVAFDAEKENMVLDAVERFVDREIKPVAQRLEHADEWPADIVAGMREMGLFGCIIREEYGGLGLAASTYSKVVERIARVWMSVSGIINSHLIMAACVQRNGTVAQRQHFLPRFASGELSGGVAASIPVTEGLSLRPHAGWNQVGNRAVRDHISGPRPFTFGIAFAREF